MAIVVPIELILVGDGLLLGQSQLEALRLLIVKGPCRLLPSFLHGGHAAALIFDRFKLAPELLELLLSVQKLLLWLGSRQLYLHLGIHLVAEVQLQVVLKMESLDLLLQIIEEVEALAELNVPVKGVGQTETNLLQVEVA